MARRIKRVKVKMHRRGPRSPRKGGFLGALAGAVLPAILGPIANRIFGRKGEGRRRRAGNLAAPYAGSRKRRNTRGGAILTPGPLA